MKVGAIIPEKNQGKRIAINSHEVNLKINSTSMSPSVVKFPFSLETWVTPSVVN
jgi:hypothetical protein